MREAAVREGWFVAVLDAGPTSRLCSLVWVRCASRLELGAAKEVIGA